MNGHQPNLLHLLLGGKTLVGNHRGQMFLVVGHQVCTHFRKDFVPLLFADPFQVFKVLRLMFGNLNLQLPPQIFYGINVWRLARPLQDLYVLLLEPLLVMRSGRACVLGHCHAGIPIHDPFSMPCMAGFNALALTVLGPIHRPIDAVQLSFPHSRT